MNLLLEADDMQGLRLGISNLTSETLFTKKFFTARFFVSKAVLGELSFVENACKHKEIRRTLRILLMSHWRVFSHFKKGVYTMKKQQILLALALLYIISQVVLLVTIGKDLELILISLGVFVASVVIVMMVGEISIGRPVIESVSMRRAERSKADQEKMLREGYQIDGEFLKKNRFEFFHRKEKYTAPLGTSPAPDTESVHEKTPQEKLKAGLIAQSPMFGGIEKLAAMLEKTDDAKVLKLLKQFGYKDVSAAEVRVIVAEIVKGETTPDGKDGANGTEVYRVKTSLNTVDFYDYIKRCMSGNDMESKREVPTITGMEILEQASSAIEGDSMRAMVRMRGVHKGGGVRKCDTCQFFQTNSMLCTKIALEVEHNDVCDGWTANVAYQAFR